eukprot:IDg21647t1
MGSSTGAYPVEDWACVELYWCVSCGKMGLRVVCVSQCVCIEVSVLGVVREEFPERRNYRLIETLCLAIGLRDVFFVSWGFIPSIRYTSYRNLALSFFPLSARTVFGIPYANAQWRVNALGTSNAVTVLRKIALTFC